MSNFFSNANLINFFFKCFAVIFSIIYFLYGVVVFQQTRIMNRIIKNSGEKIILLVSFSQIIAAAILIILSFILI